MLRTNSKEAKKNLAKYCVESSIDYLAENYGYTNINPSTIYGIIREVYHTEAFSKSQNRYVMPFEQWAQGLPCGGLFDYYLHDAVDTLGDILEETEEERNRYSESKAESALTRLIMQEVFR